MPSDLCPRRTGVPKLTLPLRSRKKTAEAMLESDIKGGWGGREGEREGGRGGRGAASGRGRQNVNWQMALNVGVVEGYTRSAPRPPECVAICLRRETKMVGSERGGRIVSGGEGRSVCDNVAALMLMPLFPPHTKEAGLGFRAHALDRVLPLPISLVTGPTAAKSRQP